MLPANIMNNLTITCHRSLEGLFSALSQESNLRPEALTMFMEHRPPPLLQPTLSRCSEPLARKHVTEPSRVIYSIEDSVSFKR